METMVAFADCLREMMRRLYWQCGNPDYNLYVRSPPLAEGASATHHWYVEIVPKFTKPGGLEVATQMAVLLNTPQAMAQKLREARPPVGKVRRATLGRAAAHARLEG